MRWMLAMSAGLGLAVALGCSGLGSSESGGGTTGSTLEERTPVFDPTPGVVWVRLEGRDDGCMAIRTGENAPVATFPAPCTDLSLAARPDGGAVLLSMAGAAFERTDAGSSPVPAPPTAEGETADYVGYAADGRLVAMSSSPLEPEMDEKAEKSWVMVDGQRFEVDYYSPMAPQLCTVSVLEGGAWKQILRRPTEIYEGAERPFCPGVEGGPEVVEQDGSDMSDYDLTEEVAGALDGLEPLKDDLASWSALKGGRGAVGAYWFEGERYTTPIAFKVGDAWTVHDFGEVGVNMTIKGRGDVIIACANAQVKAFKAGKEVWSGQGRCPVFWP